VSSPRQLAVIDIDGVLADVRHRLHLVQRQPKDWGGFFAAARHDPPLEEGLATVRRLSEAFRIVYLSGRPENCRKETLAWFRKHDLPPGELHLRRYDDRRPARLMKVEVLDRLAREAPVALLVDDDEEVCAAARKAGYDVLPATWMHEEAEEHAALKEAQESEGRT
jgi:phosphoglycolate phosphatase-like HAD superfamily hydrolase